jgi:hypothetical protein
MVCKLASRLGLLSNNECCSRIGPSIVLFKNGLIGGLASSNFDEYPFEEFRDFTSSYQQPDVALRLQEMWFEADLKCKLNSSNRKY